MFPEVFVKIEYIMSCSTRLVNVLQKIITFDNHKSENSTENVAKMTTFDPFDRKLFFQKNSTGTKMRVSHLFENLRS
jgi:hypothetical protein